MTELELNKEYFYVDLEKWFSDLVDIDPNAEWIENDRFQIEESAILINGNGFSYSFLMTGYNDSRGSIYKLIFKE